MCGIAGILDTNSSGIDPGLIQRMTKSIRHRGPDDEGYLLIDAAQGICEPRAGQDTTPEWRGSFKHISAPEKSKWNIALGHRRLSILDLSPSGHQPMSNEDGTVWIVHNGEIYNYNELREELQGKGHLFTSKTDTEVILHSYEQWGMECLKRFNGMWAFAIWDSKARKLVCSRDRFGIKPLYYYFDGSRFVFASEIKALLETDFVVRRPDNQTVFDYLAHRIQDVSEATFFDGIRQIRGGHYLELFVSKRELKLRRYYDIPMGYKLTGLTDEGYASRFRSLFENSIKLRLLSDAPVGSCLSGGLDSSAIVCMIDKLMRETGLKLPGTGDIQKTFSARFAESAYDESQFINDVIRKTGVDSHSTYPTGNNMWDNLPHLIWSQEEPCAHAYVNSQWLVYRLAKETGIKVVLDGQGGDELLAGYNPYYSALFSNLMRTIKWLDLTRELKFRYRLGGISAVRNFMEAVYKLLPGGLKLKLREYIRPDGNTCLDKGFAATQTGYYHRKKAGVRAEPDSFDEYLYEVFINTNLPRLLRDIDKNSMAHSIESRLPFLDYRLVEYAFSMPWNQKIQLGCSKFILRKAMTGIMPDSVVNRTDKVAFPTPIDIWFKTHLGNEVLTVIGSQSFKERAFLNVRDVLREFRAHQSGQKNIGNLIWRWVNLEIWMRMFMDKRKSG